MRDFFGLDEAYVRPVPAQPWRRDWFFALILCVVSVSSIMWIRDATPELRAQTPLPQSMLAILAAGALIALRRRFPIAVLLLASGVHFIVVGTTLPLVATVGGMQVLYFLGIYTAMAYARRRDTLMLVMIAVLVAMLAWLVIADSYGRAMLPEAFQPTIWYYVSTAVLNLAYFGMAIWLGRQAWLRAKIDDELTASRQLISVQSRQLADQAVIAERMRIARDLHDSVAHHISLIGVQTSAARRAMALRPAVAAEAMEEVELMSRQAVAELRSVLGSLRDVDEGSGPQTVQALAALADESSGEGMRVTYQLVGDPALAGQLTPMQASNLLRIAQEALTNVRRHSTANEVRMVLRLDTDIQLEVTDNGMPSPGTAGTGLGHVGVRERVAAMGGTAEIGPRATIGYRVLVRVPRRSAS